MEEVILKHHTFTGCGKSEAQHEIHIFLGPINPSLEKINEYYELVNNWNKIHAPNWQTKYGKFYMKACLLCLIFREKETFEEYSVYVMQSSVYIKSNDIQTVMKEANIQNAYFESNGLPVIRTKIEAMAAGINEIPQKDSDLIVYQDEKVKDPYFEFHIKCKVTGDQTDEIEKLKTCANHVTLKYGSPCPLSYNVNPDQLQGDHNGLQRFINVRFRNLGYEKIKEELKLIKSYLLDIEVIKIISEYVWYDTNPELDRGWIDFYPEEKELFIKHITKIDF